MFENNPANLRPNAIVTAPVSVESSTKMAVLYSYWVQFMQSASTNLPSASVFPIFTVIPFRLVMISDGRYEVEEMKFSTNPIDTVRFTLAFCSTRTWKAPKTLQAPCYQETYFSSFQLSIRDFLPDLIFKPPASKQTPFPTNAIH